MSTTMRSYWDAAASVDPVRYSATGFASADDRFLASGERDAWGITRQLGVPLASVTDLLEIGVGAGRTLATFARVVPNVVAADVSPAMLDVARATVGDSEVDYVALEGDGSLPFPDASFDLVFSQYTLQHVVGRDAQRHYVAESARVIRVGGTALLQIGRPDLRHRAIDLLADLRRRADGRRSLSRAWRGSRSPVETLHDAPDDGVQVNVLNLEDRYLWLVLRRRAAVS